MVFYIYDIYYFVKVVNIISKDKIDSLFCRNQVYKHWECHTLYRYQL